MKIKFLGAIAARAIFAAVPSAQASVLAYETSTSNFGMIDLTTGQYTFIGNAGQTLAGLGNYSGNSMRG